jgi:hypothetical protein
MNEFEGQAAESSDEQLGKRVRHGGTRVKMAEGAALFRPAGL